MNSDKELTSRTLAQILSLIEKRNYDPGERLPSERELSERFGVGRGVVRESLSVLENLRYLKRKRNSGIYLTSTPERISLETLSLFSELGINLTKDKITQALEVKTIIEVQAILLACQRRTEEQLEEIEDIVRRFDEAIAGSGEPIADLDYEFHMALFKATHNTVLIQMVNPFYIISSHRREIFFSDIARCKVSNQQHKQLLACLRKQDAATAQKIMLDHIGRGESGLLRNESETPQ
jgi:DNA-binding FadR family transcriptional regulator